MVADEIRTRGEATLRKGEMGVEIDRLEHHLALVRSITQSLLPNSVKVLKSRDGTSLQIKPAEIRTTGRFFGTVKLWPHGDWACLAGDSCFCDDSAT